MWLWLVRFCIWIIEIWITEDELYYAHISLSHPSQMRFPISKCWWAETIQWKWVLWNLSQYQQEEGKWSQRNIHVTYILNIKGATQQFHKTYLCTYGHNECDCILIPQLVSCLGLNLSCFHGFNQQLHSKWIECEWIDGPAYTNFP